MTETDPDSAPEQDRPVRSGARSFALLVLVAGLAFALDRVSKILVVENLPLGEPVPILGELLHFRFVENDGAAFSIGGGLTWVFAIAAAGVAVFIVVFARRIRSLAWATVFGLLLGGTLGNLFDRLTRPPGFGVGHVVDFIQLWGFPAIFNIADIAIVSSMALFILLTLRGVGLDGQRASAAKKAVAPDEADPEPDEA